MNDENKKSLFDELNGINVNEKVEQKQGLNYLSWAFAWGELKKRYPDASYTIERFGEEKKPYLYDKDLGYMVFTTVTIGGLTHEMWLPVMDGANKAMKATPYKYKVKNFEKTCEAATMFDINKTIMRCLVKNIGMFGLGLYIYAGEDLPEEQTKDEEQKKTEVIESYQKKCVEVGINLDDTKTQKFIADRNNGKFKVEEMNEYEVGIYLSILEALIKAKLEKNASNSEKGVGTHE